MKKAGVMILAVVLLFSSVSLVPVSAQECLTPCTSNVNCNVDQSCNNGCCDAINCDTQCVSDSDCAFDHKCDNGCCASISCAQDSDCPSPCPAPAGVAPSVFFPMQCNFCQDGFCVDPPPPCPGSTLCTAGCTGNNPICGGTCCVGCSPAGTDNGNNCPDDGDPCTSKNCDSNGSCSNPAKDCDDQDKCTTDSCSGGNCINTPTNCNDNIFCTSDSCNQQNGNCDNDPNDAACDDGVGCTDDKCDKNDGCLFTPKDNNCDDGLQCTDDMCDQSEDCQFSCKNGDSDGDGICT